MRRRTPLRRRARLRSRRCLPSARRSSRRAQTSGFPAEVVDLALERAQWSCELCGRAPGDRRGVDWSAHHRRPRAAGGTTDPAASTAANCLIVCGSGTTGCHGVIERYRRASYDAGWLVPQWVDPARMPVLLTVDGLRREVLLTVDGRYREVA